MPILIRSVPVFSATSHPLAIADDIQTKTLAGGRGCDDTQFGLLPFGWFARTTGVAPARSNFAQ
jgi:hypothetical protein